ncbi:MAG: 16S rRNA (uracil(1498)-N(3))-methyltransferase [Myxococcales bacterium]
MNLLLLRPDELRADGTARLRGRRLLHAREVLRLREGDVLRAGVLDGPVGTAELVRLDEEEMVLRPDLTEPPPPRPGVDLLLALPRPKALRKVLPAAASLGVDRIVLVNAARVEKSYFDSRVLDPDAMRELLILGLEQARDTRLPEVLVRERFRPLVEDEVAGLWPDSERLVAHPAARAGPRPPPGRAVIAIGPEGGWVPFEIDLLGTHGFKPFTLGPRTLRVEVAVPYAVGAISGKSLERNRGHQ